jgi:hypothetical protein
VGTDKHCRWCGETKPIEAFHRHSGMKDGRLNKCGTCVVAAVNAWRAKNPDARAKEYMRGEGAAKRARGLKKRANGTGPCPEARRRASLKYVQKRYAIARGQHVNFTELDDLAWQEAKDLCVLRTLVVGGEWQIDHIVPLMHREVSGLHRAENFQVAPALWNQKKGNRYIGRYLGPSDFLWEGAPDPVVASTPGGVKKGTRHQQGIS